MDLSLSSAAWVYSSANGSDAPGAPQGSCGGGNGVRPDETSLVEGRCGRRLCMRRDDWNQRARTLVEASFFGTRVSRPNRIDRKRVGVTAGAGSVGALEIRDRARRRIRGDR